MGLRDTINEKPAVAYAIFGVLVVLGILLLLWNFGVFGGPSTGSGEIFITSDKGQTYEPAERQALRAKGADGQPVVQAHVFQFPGDEPTVAYLERFNPQALEMMLRSQNADDARAGMQVNQMEAQSREVAAPGTDQWHDVYTREGQAIIKIPERDGVRAERVSP